MREEEPVRWSWSIKQCQVIWLSPGACSLHRPFPSRPSSSFPPFPLCISLVLCPIITHHSLLATLHRLHHRISLRLLPNVSIHLPSSLDHQRFLRWQSFRYFYHFDEDNPLILLQYLTDDWYHTIVCVSSLDLLSELLVKVSSNRYAGEKETKQSDIYMLWKRYTMD